MSAAVFVRAIYMRAVPCRASARAHCCRLYAARADDVLRRARYMSAILCYAIVTARVLPPFAPRY